MTEIGIFSSAEVFEDTHPLIMNIDVGFLAWKGKTPKPPIQLAGFDEANLFQVRSDVNAQVCGDFSEI